MTGPVGRGILVGPMTIATPILPGGGDDEGGGLGQVIKLAWPASLTMLNATVLKFVDGLMVSHVSPDAMSAQFQAGMWSFVPESFVMGILTVVNTYVAQNFGRRRLARTATYAWAGLIIAVAAGALMAPLAVVAPGFFGLLGHGARVAELEAMYFRYMILTVWMTLSARVLEQFFYGVHRPGVVLAASLAANGFNVAANYALIFGVWGFPMLGLEGAAIGTVAAWALQLGLLVGVFVSRRYDGQFRTRRLRGLRGRHVADLLRTGLPAGVQLANDILCWSLFTGVLVGSFFGRTALAATTIAMRYLGLSFMPTVGIGIAATAIVGKHIGEGRPDVARRRAHTALGVAMVYMGLCGLAFWVFRAEMVDVFLQNVPLGEMTQGQLDAMRGEIMDIGVKILICAAVFQLLDAVGIVYIGALRGAGDTRWPMVVTMILSWSVVLGVGWSLATWAPQLGSLGPWIASSLYVVLLGVFMAGRFERGRWRQIDLLGDRRRRGEADEVR